MHAFTFPYHVERDAGGDKNVKEGALAKPPTPPSHEVAADCGVSATVPVKSMTGQPGGPVHDDDGGSSYLVAALDQEKPLTVCPKSVQKIAGFSPEFCKHGGLKTVAFAKEKVGSSKC